MRRTSRPAVALAGSLFALAGCANMAGLGGSSNYACQAPEGVTCNSVSGVYANAVRNNLPSQRARAAAQASAPASGLPSAAVRAPGAEPSSDEELRSRPRILRLWFKPWEDADGDLFDQGYVYVQVDAGRWQVDHVRRRIRESFAPVRPPVRGAGASAAPETRSAPRLPSELQEPRQVPRPVVPQAGTD